MTVPIIPGPFSFLGTAGQAAGGYLEGRRQAQRQQLEDKMRNVGVILNLINSGVLRRQTLSDPGMVQLLSEIGMDLGGQENVVPSFDESKADFLSQFNKELGQPPVPVTVGVPGRPGGMTTGIPRSATPKFKEQFPDEQRLLFGAPTSADLAKTRETAAISGARAAAVEGGTPQERGAIAGIPSPQQQIAQTAEVGRQLAQTAAAAGMARTGNRFTKETRDIAWAIAQEGAAAAGFNLNPQRDRPFVDAELYLLDFERQKAEALMAYRSGGQVDDLLQRVQQMRQTLTASINALEEPSLADRSLAGVARERLAADPNATLPSTLRNALDYVNAYEAKLGQLRAEENDLNATWRVIMRGRGTSVPPGEVQSGIGGITRITLPEQTINTLIERHRQMKDEDRLRQAVLQLGGNEDDVQHIIAASAGGR